METITELNHINIRTNLMEETKDFYVDVIGLKVGFRPPFRDHGYWLYAGGRDVLHLSECSPGEQRAVHVATTFDHVAFTCTDFVGTRARLETLGIAFGQREVAATGIRQLFFKDPAGNGIEFNFAADEH